MKSLKIKGVETLTQKELRCIGGGGWIVPAIVGALIGIALSQDLDKLAEAFNEGYNRARNKN